MLVHVLAALLCAHTGVAETKPHPGHGPVADWVLVPEHALQGRAGTRPGPRSPQPTTQAPAVWIESPDIRFMGEKPTERRTHLIDPNAFHAEAHTVELWILDHVNQHVGVLGSWRDRGSDGEPLLLVGYHGRRLLATSRRTGFADATITVSQLPRYSGYKQWWHHVVATHDGRWLRLYHNGQLAGELETGAIAASSGTQPDFELAAYTHAEPFMGLEHLLRGVRVWDHALSASDIASRYEELTRLADEGIIDPGRFHFTAGPYLHMATPESINLTWETDRPAKARIAYGTGESLDKTMEFDAGPRGRVATIAGLAPDTTYFYRLELTDESGAAIDSGLLSFRTAPVADRPIRFAVIGDTEARPHINHRVASLLWRDRPDFLVNLGDLTDGGQHVKKFEWTHEYFTGLGAISGRIPSFPVPGNGESDLHWFSYYHDFPSPDATEGYYTFRYGPAQFFMLDSNRSKTDFKPGGAQYEWLKAELATSTAKWKFACHHHPTYTSDNDDYGDTFKNNDSPFGDTDVQQIISLYEQGGIDMVFFGHLHAYERSLPIRNGRYEAGGIIHVQAGGGGGNLEDFAPHSTWFSGKVQAGHHYLMLSIIDNTLELRMYDIDGDMIDLFSITK